MSTISPETALIYTMVLVSASDREMSDTELRRMGVMVQSLPAFAGYDANRLVTDANGCADILADDEGLDAVIGLIYAVACEVAVADGRLSQDELRVLELIRHRLNVDRLTAAAIERGAAARRKTFNG